MLVKWVWAAVSEIRCVQMGMHTCAKRYTSLVAEREPGRMKARQDPERPKEMLPHWS